MKTRLIIVVVHNTTAMYAIARRSYRMAIKMVALSSTAAGVCQQVQKTRKIKYIIYKK